MTDKKYNTPYALLMAINDRLQAISKNEKVTVNRLRRHLAFDRLLVRLFEYEKMSLGFKKWLCDGIVDAKRPATKDIDLALFEHVELFC